MREFDYLCRYMTERYLFKYVSSTRVNSCESFSGLAEAHEVTAVFIKLIVAIERYLEPESLLADPYCSSDSTLSDDDVVPSAELPKLAPEPAYAGPLEEVGTSSASPHIRCGHAAPSPGSRKSRKKLQCRMEAMEARTKLNRKANRATNAKALRARKQKDWLNLLLTIMQATSQD
eukprot:624184-Pleurochrysis_carterae.AAC.2